MDLRKVFAGFAALVLLAGFFAGCRRKYVLPPVAFTLTSDQLFKEFKEAKASNAKYVGKVLQVSGIADHVGADSSGQTYVAFKGEEGAGDVQCYFPRNQAESVSKTAKGQRVTLKGICLVKVIHVALDSCELVQK